MHKTPQVMKGDGCVRQRGRGGRQPQSQWGPRPGDTGDHDEEQAGRSQPETHLGRRLRVVGGRRWEASLQRPYSQRATPSSLPIPRGSASVQHPLLNVSHPLCPLLAHSPQATCKHEAACSPARPAPAMSDPLLPCGAGTSDPPPGEPSPGSASLAHSTAHMQGHD